MKHLRLIALLFIVLVCTLGCAKKEMIVTDSITSMPAGQTTASSPDKDPASIAMLSEAVAAPAISEKNLLPTDTESIVANPLKTVYFDFDSWLLTAQSRETLARNGEWLRNNPTVAVLLAGHTDERGSDAYNLALGDQRAKSVLKYLLSLGIDAERLDTVSYGEEKPMASGHDETAWSKNRRVEFIVRK